VDTVGRRPDISPEMGRILETQAGFLDVSFVSLQELYQALIVVISQERDCVVLIPAGCSWKIRISDAMEGIDKRISASVYFPVRPQVQFTAKPTTQ